MNEVYIKVANLNKWVGKYFKNKDLITVDDLIAKIEDLDEDIERLQKELEDEKQDKEDNYKPLKVWEQL